MQEYNSDEWYTPDQAKEKLENNSGKKIDYAYIRNLARLGKIGRIKLGPNFSIYKKSDIDAYKIEGRGRKKKNKHDHTS